MSRLHQSYNSVMSMPIGRRKRFCEEQEHLDLVRSRRK